MLNDLRAFVDINTLDRRKNTERGTQKRPQKCRTVYLILPGSLMHCLLSVQQHYRATRKILLIKGQTQKKQKILIRDSPLRSSTLDHAGDVHLGSVHYLCQPE